MGEGIAQAADEADATGGMKRAVSIARISDFARFVGVTAEMWARAGLGPGIANDVKRFFLEGNTPALEPA